MMQFIVNITISGFSEKFLLSSVPTAARGASDPPAAAPPPKRSGISLDLFVLWPEEKTAFLVGHLLYVLTSNENYLAEEDRQEL